MATHNEQDSFSYQLLARLKQDCEFYLGDGNRSKKRLWAGDEAEQIQKMQELFAGFSVKPEWITLEDIERYEVAMTNCAQPATVATSDVLMSSPTCSALAKPKH